ncbi:DUF302 domain-containing protein [Primorskyibacter sp. S187A]|uniref:DUF302 domain-containing protein n=1 Tax=Primorskyibacter sp. S187A TaxID=3415130 RepID=UPI003C7DD592
MKPIFLACALLSATSLAAEDFAITHPYDGTFEDAVFSVENAILDAGLVIDHHAHTGDMLERTRADMGGETLFAGADVFLFCSAQLSREVMEEDPALVAFCPYSIFITDRTGLVEIGYRTYPPGPMDKVEAFLEVLVQDALAF